MSEYLVQYGVPAYVGRFATPDPFARGDRVIVRTPRGVEAGTVLCEPAARFAGQIDPAAGGDLLRRVTAEDDRDLDRLTAVVRAVAADADRRLAGGPASVLDAEATLDPPAVILHVLAWGETDLTPTLAELSAAFGVAVRVHDTGRTPAAVAEPAGGCGKPGCGSEGGCSTGGCGTGGGCSTGGCSRGSVKSADELTAYFADLRRQMEVASRRTPLG